MDVAGMDVAGCGLCGVAHVDAAVGAAAAAANITSTIAAATARTILPTWTFLLQLARSPKAGAPL